MVDALPSRRLTRRRSRRVIEIRDAWLELRGRFRPATADRLHAQARSTGLRGEALEAVVEAGQLAVALTDHEDPSAAARPGSAAPVRGGGNLDAEVAWLRRVSLAFSRSPVVADAVAAANPRSPMGGRRQALLLARVITEATAPAPVLVALLLVIGAASGPTRLAGLGWGLLAAVFFSVIPFAGIVWAVLHGRVSDHHVSQLAQRPVVVVLSVVSFLVGVIVMTQAEAPHPLTHAMIALLAAATVCLLVTLHWKISMHTAVCGCAAGLLPLILGLPMLSLWPVLVVVAWARVRLGDHTLSQTVAGAAVGMAVAVTVYSALS